MTPNLSVERTTCKRRFPVPPGLRPPVALELARWASYMKRFAAALLIGFSSTAFSCYVPPPELFREHASLVDEASSILLVEAVAGPKPKLGSCQLRVSRTLKGPTPEPLPVTCRLPRAGDWMTDFSAHTAPSFWETRGGRLGITSYCTLVPPAFRVGKTYLVFLGVRPDTKQFEEISGSTDRWLTYVQDRLSQRKP